MTWVRGNPYLRNLDRYAGIPLLGLIRAARKRPDPPATIRRIGFLKLTAIGDTVLLGAVLGDVATALQDAEIVLFVGSENASVARLLSGPSEVVELPATDPLAVLRELRRRQLDVVVDCGPWSRMEAGYAALSGAFSIGFKTRGQLRHLCQDISVEHSDQAHEIDNYRRLVEPLGIASVSLPRLTPPGTMPTEGLPQRPYVVLHPWPSGIRKELKEWPNARWRELAGRLSAAGYNLVLSGGPNDRQNSEALSVSLPVPVTNLAGNFDLAAMVDIVSASACVISVNTGTMHVAASAGAPTVGLNGPTSELRWGPIGERAISVNSSFGGCGYLDLGGEYEGQRQDCMLGISVGAVLEAFVKVTGLSLTAVSPGVSASE
jgi:heptosyltransferase III